jgi:glycosyltransferase involved in cell wall biosynthesis
MENRVLIWNAHWRQTGGGEKYAFLLGKSLFENGFAVDFACFSSSDLRYAKNLLNIENFAFNLVVVAKEDDLLTHASGYDLFINASFGSSMIAPIQNSIYLCHFPHFNRKYKYLSKFIGKSKQTTVHDLSGTIMNPQFPNVLWSDKNVYIDMINNDEIEVSCVQNSITLVEQSSTEEIKLNQKKAISTPGIKSILINRWTASSFTIEGLKRASVFKVLISRYFPTLFPIITYKKVWANSKFTSNWIDEYWQTPNSIVYPPVRTKKNPKVLEDTFQILSVGRFMSPRNNHSKNQLLMVKAFAKLYKKDSRYALTLVGGLDPSQNDYFERVVKTAENLPIEVIPNASDQELAQCYDRFNIYWHATGLGQSRRNPYKMEHFGISVVEAMSAGLIPLVFNQGGPAEILSQFPELIYDSIDDLVEKTLNLKRQDLRDLQARLIQESRKYDEESFTRSLWESLN